MLERASVTTCLPGWPRSCAARAAAAALTNSGSPARSLLAVEDQLERLLVGQHVLGELRAERGEPLVDGGDALLRRSAPSCAPLRTKPGVVALEDAELLGVERRGRAPLEEARRCGRNSSGSSDDGGSSAAASLGDSSRSISCRSGLVSAPVRL